MGESFLYTIPQKKWKTNKKTRKYNVLGVFVRGVALDMGRHADNCEDVMYSRSFKRQMQTQNIDFAHR